MMCEKPRSSGVKVLYLDVIKSKGHDSPSFEYIQQEGLTDCNKVGACKIQSLKEWG